MSKLSNRFNLDVEKIKTRSFTYGGHIFKVKVPLMGEINGFETRLIEEKANVAAIEAIYQERIKGLELGDKVTQTENDWIVAGRSVREAASSEHVSRVRITWLFNLLVKENDDGLGDLSYDDIAADLPIQIQVDIIERISQTLHPDPEEAKKNSGEVVQSSSVST